MKYPGMTQEEKQLIDRYLDNSLTGYELKEFLDRLESDNNLKSYVSFHNLLIEGIQEAEDKRLSADLEKSIGYNRPFIPVAVKLIITFLLITAGGIAFWNYTGPDSTGNRNKYFSLDFLKSRKDLTPNPPIEKTIVSNKKTSQKKDQSPVENTVKAEPKNTDSTGEQKAPIEDIVVKQDQLLVSINLKSTAIEDSHSDTNENNSDVDNAKRTVDKLNPDASLPDIENKKDNNYTVEFWVSPVNYRGYKLINEKLILFGIEEPDAIQLFSKEEKLWMKYGKTFYSIEKSDNFESFIATNEIPSALK